MSTSPTNPYASTFLYRGGEMGKPILNHDWSQTSIPVIEQWPPSLKNHIEQPSNLGISHVSFLGDDLLCFYNDTFIPSFGHSGKHSALGKKGEEVWAEIWHFIAPFIYKVKTMGEPVYLEDELIPFSRNGATEDIYWAFSNSPVFEPGGSISGVWLPV